MRRQDKGLCSYFGRRARFTGAESEIRLDLHEPEFEAWKWVEVDDLPKLIVPFKRALYEALVAEFGDRVRAIAKP